MKELERTYDMYGDSIVLNERNGKYYIFKEDENAYHCIYESRTYKEAKAKYDFEVSLIDDWIEILPLGGENLNPVIN